MKKYFITGLAILLPAVMTIWIISLIMNLLTTPFLGLVKALFTNDFFLTYPFLIKFLSQLLVLSIMVIGTVLIGVIANRYIINYFFKWTDYLLHRIPLFNSIYKATQDVVSSVFATDSPSFSQVVLVPFPHANTLSIGLISREQIRLQNDPSGQEMIAVLIPGTPNPTVGFMLKFKREQVLFTDMSVEAAMKFVVSCGVIAPPFKLIPK